MVMVMVIVIWVMIWVMVWDIWMDRIFFAYNLLTTDLLVDVELWNC